MRETTVTIALDGGAADRDIAIDAIRETWGLLDGPESLVVVRALAGMGKSHLVHGWIADRRRRGINDVVSIPARELGAPLGEQLRAGQHRVLVIDGADALSAPQLDELYALLLADPALKAVLCVATVRGVARVGAPGGLTVREIGAARLKIAEEELASVLEGWSAAGLAIEQGNAIHALTDGWPGLAHLLASEVARVGTGPADAAAAV
ncbi:hypothetical protein, partial [Kitasatospora indigofera]|uniref:hypothetical protein n=1 Tax=Kitasatospora indigofera TaxID=67307 RepID=UPI0036B040D1